MKLIRVKCSDDEFSDLSNSINKLNKFDPDYRIKEFVNILNKFFVSIKGSFNNKKEKQVEANIKQMKNNIILFRKSSNVSTDFGIALLNIMDKIDDVEKMFFKERQDW